MPALSNSQIGGESWRRQAEATQNALQIQYLLGQNDQKSRQLSQLFDLVHEQARQIELLKEQLASQAAD